MRLVYNDLKLRMEIAQNLLYRFSFQNYKYLTVCCVFMVFLVFRIFGQQFDRVRLKTRVSGAGRGRTGRKLTTAKIHIIKTNRKKKFPYEKSGVDFPVVVKFIFTSTKISSCLLPRELIVEVAVKNAKEGKSDVLKINHPVQLVLD